MFNEYELIKADDFIDRRVDRELDNIEYRPLVVDVDLICLESYIPILKEEISIEEASKIYPFKRKEEG